MPPAGARREAQQNQRRRIWRPWILLGLAYLDNAIGNRFIYRAMFMEQLLDETDAATGLETFGRMTATLARCSATGRFTR